MAEPKPLITVKVNLDKERIMLVDWSAMYSIEEAITKRRGGPWVSLQDLGDLSKVSIADMRTLVWGSLIHEDPKLTEGQVGKWVHMGNAEYVCEKLAEAMGADDKEEKPNPAPASDNGKASLPATDG